MGTPFLSEIKIVSFNFAPKGWAQCNGQLLPINQNQALFSLLGTTYGGDGRVNFGLPNLQGRVPIHMGSGFTLGQLAGEVAHTVTISEMPQHVHTMQATATIATANVPSGTLAPAEPVANVGAIYGPATTPTAMAPQAIANTGGSQAHTNLQPYLVLNMCIALQGIFPSQN